MIPFYQGMAWTPHPELFLVATWSGIASLSFVILLCNALLLQGLEAIFGDTAESTGAGFLRNAALLV